MAQYSPSGRVALLNWVNTFVTPPRPKVARLAELREGVVLGEVLERILAADPQGDHDFQAATALVQSPATPAERKLNMERVSRELGRFLRADGLAGPSPAEFRALAENLDDNAICEFLSYYLAAACLGSLATHHVPTIFALDTASQGEIKRVLEAVQRRTAQQHARARAAADSAMASGASSDALGYSPPASPPPPDMAAMAARDADLLAEENERLEAEREAYKRRAADLQVRLDDLLVKHQELKAELEERQDELRARERASVGDAPATIRTLKSQLDEKITEIDRLEDAIDKETRRANRNGRENDVLRSKVEESRELADRVTELAHENKELLQQMKVMDNYKKKAQDHTVLQQRCRSLEETNIQLEQGLQELDTTRTRNKQLQKEIEEKRRALASVEVEILDLVRQKSALQDAYEELKTANEWLERKRALDASTIKELEDKLLMGGITSAQPVSSLEEELDATTDPRTATLRLDVSRLKAENGLLRNSMAVGSENERLRADLDRANEKVGQYRLHCNEAMEKHAVAQEQINALVSGHADDRDHVFTKLRRDLLESADETGRQRKRADQLQRQANDRDRELLELKADLNAISEDSQTALTVLKSADGLISASLRTELEGLRRQFDDKAKENEILREQLMDVLVSNNNIRNKLDDALLASASTAVASPAARPSTPAPTEEQSVSAEKRTRREEAAAEKNEKLKTALRQKVQQLEKAEQDKYELQRRLKAVENGSALASQKAATDQVIKNLQRENAMISTAWYDLTSRLQSNHVVLQRRHDIPKSWLNKQRQMVNATPRR